MSVITIHGYDTKKVEHMSITAQNLPSGRTTESVVLELGTSFNSSQTLDKSICSTVRRLNRWNRSFRD